jgi:hypothetical protein
MKKLISKLVLTGVLITCLVNFASCGYFLYPERRGQRAGNIDVPILLLDCGLLVFFIIPGAVALAVDFTSGCIYTQRGGKSAELQVTRFANTDKPLSKPALEALIASKTGLILDLESAKTIEISSNRVDVQKTLAYLHAHINEPAALQAYALSQR